MKTNVSEIKAGLQALPGRKTDQLENFLKEYVDDITECLQRNVPRKDIRAFLASHEIKISPIKFKAFLETHVLPKLRNTAEQALADARSKASGDKK